MTHPSRSRGAAGRSAGFTLAEVLVSVSLGAVIVTAFAAMAGMFGSQIDAVVADIDRSLEEGLSSVGMAVQEAWTVEQVSDTRLDVTNAVGEVTSYWLDGNTLKITRPSGAVGVLMSGVANVEFDVGTMERLRDAASIDSYGLAWDRRIDDATSMKLSILGGDIADEVNIPYYAVQDVPGVLTDGDQLALAFTLDSQAPEALSPVAGVTEQVRAVGLGGVLLPLGALPYLPTPPFSKHEVNQTGAGNKGNGGNSGNGNTKVSIAHVPPGNPASCQTVLISQSAVDAHLAHGDSTGECPPAVPGTLYAELYEARGPDDTRSVGAALGSTSFPVSAFPEATYEWEGVTVNGDNVTYDGSPASLVVLPPDTDMSLDLTALGAEIVPGVPYVIVLRYSGDGAAFVRRRQGAVAATSGVATRWAADTDFTPASLEVELALEGTRTVSQTQRIDAIVRVTSRIEMLDGRVIAGSAVVASQLAVDEPWYGPVPGEFPDLELRGQ